MNWPIYRNKKNRNLYYVTCLGTNCTNEQDGQKMYQYYSVDDHNFQFAYFREQKEFHEKFEKA